VVANLKAKNLVKFKSHGMVLCAARDNGDGTGETVEFVEPPLSAKPGDVVTFDGLPNPIPLAPSQVEKKKVFGNCLEGLRTDGEGIATWKGHKFVVGEGNYCRTKTVCNGPMR
jgi:aminoacyl tRNA synthase complex-interacting multifunctional protein 1